MPPRKGKHWSQKDIMEVAEDIGDGYSEATITLYHGDTAYYPGSTKKTFRTYYDQSGEVRYLIHAMGWRYEYDNAVYAGYKD
jgi:hypothetical protein